MMIFPFSTARLFCFKNSRNIQIDKRFQSGFTLIEMIVVLGLMALMLGGSIAGYRKFNERQTVLQGGKEFVSALRLAQKRASVGDKPDVAGCNAGEKLEGYRVRGSNGESVYLVVPLCNGVEVTAAEQDYTFSGDVVFKQNVDIRFYVLSRGTDFGAGGNSVTIVMGNVQAPGYTFTIQVTRTGEIYEQGMAAF